MPRLGKSLACRLLSDACWLLEILRWYSHRETCSLHQVESEKRLAGLKLPSLAARHCVYPLDSVRCLSCTNRNSTSFHLALQYLVDQWETLPALEPCAFSPGLLVRSSKWRVSFATQSGWRRSCVDALLVSIALRKPIHQESSHAGRSRRDSDSAVVASDYTRHVS